MTQHPVSKVLTEHCVAFFHASPAYDHRRAIGFSRRNTVAFPVIHDTGHPADLAWGRDVPWGLRRRLLFDFGWGGGTILGVLGLRNSYGCEKTKERHDSSETLSDVIHPCAPVWRE